MSAPPAVEMSRTAGEASDDDQELVTAEQIHVVAGPGSAPAMEPMGLDADLAAAMNEIDLTDNRSAEEKKADRTRDRAANKAHEKERKKKAQMREGKRSPKQVITECFRCDIGCPCL